MSILILIQYYQNKDKIIQTDKRVINKFITEFYVDVLNTKMVYENVKNKENILESENEFDI